MMTISLDLFTKRESFINGKCIDVSRSHFTTAHTLTREFVLWITMLSFFFLLLIRSAFFHTKALLMIVWRTVTGFKETAILKKKRLNYLMLFIQIWTSLSFSRQSPSCRNSNALSNAFKEILRTWIVGVSYFIRHQ